MPLVILHHLLNVFVQLANKRDSQKRKKIVEQDSSVGIANGWMARIKFLHHNVHTFSGYHPASCTISANGSLSKGKVARV
jgi:hypothetical protein